MWVRMTLPAVEPLTILPEGLVVEMALDLLLVRGVLGHACTGGVTDAGGKSSPFGRARAGSFARASRAGIREEGSHPRATRSGARWRARTGARCSVADASRRTGSARDLVAAARDGGRSPVARPARGEVAANARGRSRGRSGPGRPGRRGGNRPHRLELAHQGVHECIDLRLESHLLTLLRAISLALGLPNGVTELTVGVGQASRSDGGPLPCRLRLALGPDSHLRGDRLDLLRVALARDERPACAAGHRARDVLHERIDHRRDGARIAFGGEAIGVRLSLHEERGERAPGLRQAGRIDTSALLDRLSEAFRLVGGPLAGRVVLGRRTFATRSAGHVRREGNEREEDYARPDRCPLNQAA